MASIETRRIIRYSYRRVVRRNAVATTILEAYGGQTLEAALGVGVSAWRESDHDDDELEDFFFSSDVLFLTTSGGLTRMMILNLDLRKGPGSHCRRWSTGRAPASLALQ